MIFLEWLILITPWTVAEFINESILSKLAAELILRSNLKMGQHIFRMINGAFYSCRNQESSFEMRPSNPSRSNNDRPRLN